MMSYEFHDRRKEQRPTPRIRRRDEADATRRWLVAVRIGFAVALAVLLAGKAVGWW